MLSRIRWIVLVLAIIGLPLVANTTWAGDGDSDSDSDSDRHKSRFSRLSAAHTQYGVSQYNYGIVPREGGGPMGFLPAPMKLMNPNSVTQIAAVLVYNRSEDASEVEEFLGCVVNRLTPHAALDLTSPVVGGNFPTGEADAFVVPPGFPPRYAEVIWAPEDKVRVRGRGTRLADGLGGRSQGAVNTTAHHLAHPSLFSLPSNDVVLGQREAAVECVCNNLMLLELDSRTFRDFGIRCY